MTPKQAEALLQRLMEQATAAAAEKPGRDAVERTITHVIDPTPGLQDIPVTQLLVQHRYDTFTERMSLYGKLGPGSKLKPRGDHYAIELWHQGHLAPITQQEAVTLLATGDPPLGWGLTPQESATQDDFDYLNGHPGQPGDMRRSTR